MRVLFARELHEGRRLFDFGVFSREIYARVGVYSNAGAYSLDNSTREGVY